MKKNHTYIAMLLDRSGSMNGSQSDVIGGVNTFLEQQKKLNGTALVTIAKFDNEYETVYEDQDLKSARLLTESDYVPRGGTALFDAINRLITHIGAKLAALSESDRPDQVIFLIFTDGHENQSTEIINGRLIQEQVKHQTEKYGWKFIFFGADIDAFAAGGALGIKGMSSSKGTGGVMRSARAASAYVGYSRMGHHDAAAQLLSQKHVDDEGTAKGIQDFLTAAEEEQGEN